MLAVADNELGAALGRVVSGAASRRRLFLADLASATFDRLRAFVATLPMLRVGYSVKTNPRIELLREALRCGFYAECISSGEIAAAINAGFKPAQIVYNGPIPATMLTTQPKFVFADSIESYAADCAALPAVTIGIRIRPPGIESRFGVGIEHLERLARTIRECGRRETAVSFQVRSEDYGTQTFRDITTAAVDAASTLAVQTGVPIVAFDSGGGRSAAEFDRSAAAGDYRFMHELVQRRLPHVREILLEPGQELDFSVEAMVAPIVEVRGSSPIEIIVDAGRPDFPAIDKTPHRLFLLRNGSISQLSPGSDRILGRTCLEDDVVGTVALSAEVRCGDAIVIADIGAYDASMRFAFAQGYESGNTAL